MKILDKLKEVAFDVGAGLIQKVTRSGLAQLLGGKPEDHAGTEAERLASPIYAEMTKAFLDAGLLEYLIGSAQRSQVVAVQVWELRRPYDEKITELLRGLGPKGNPR